MGPVGNKEGENIESSLNIICSNRQRVLKIHHC